MPTLSHPFLQEGVEARAYQLICAKDALSQSALMVLPTGFGKTAVQWMVMADQLRISKKKTLLIAPTTGLVDQQVKMAREFIAIDPSLIVTYTGDSKPELRSDIWKEGAIIIATPQVIRNDHYASRIDVQEIGTLILDEVHHCKGNHAYGQVADIFVNESPETRILGASASPGTKKNEIDSIMIRLGMTKLTYFEKDDDLLEPYKSELEINEIKVKLSDKSLQLIAPLERLKIDLANQLIRNGFLGASGYITASALDAAQNSASTAIRKGDKRGYNAAKTVSDLRRLHLLIEMMKCQGNETAKKFLDRCKEKSKSGDRSLSRFMKFTEIRDISEILSNITETHPKPEIVLHSVKSSLEESPNSKIIIFTEYRDTVDHLVDYLSVNGVNARQFIGQASTKDRKGMTSKQQLAQLQDFRNGEFEVLVATSVGEEGLDIPSSDLVIFYEPVPSAIRMIQRRGRTGRKEAGNVKVLVTLNTKEEMIKKSSLRKEKRMNSILSRVKTQLKMPKTGIDISNLDHFSVVIDGNKIPCSEFILEQKKLLEKEVHTLETKEKVPIETQSKEKIQISNNRTRPSNQTGLFQFDGNDSNKKEEKYSKSISSEITEKVDMKVANKPVLDAHSIVIKTNLEVAQDVVSSISDHVDLSKVTVDYREASSTLCSEMKRIGCEFSLGHISTGDIRIGSRILIERKTATDFHKSIIDGRLLNQARRLLNSAPRPLLIVEIGSGSSIGVHPNATLGALAHLSIEFGLSVITTKDSRETAKFVKILAKKELEIIDKMWAEVNRSMSVNMSLGGLNPLDEKDQNKWQNKCIEAAENWINEAHQDSTLIKRWKEKNIEQKVNILTSIDCINDEVALKIIDEIGGIHGLVGTTVDELESITQLSRNECSRILEQL